MILVDSSVWIEYFRGTAIPEVELLDGLFGRRLLFVGDLIAVEVLQGVRDEREYNRVRATLDAFTKIDLVGHEVALKAARNFRTLRDLAADLAGVMQTSLARWGQVLH
mgnify:CR=1 FL=1